MKIGSYLGALALFAIAACSSAPKGTTQPKDKPTQTLGEKQSASQSVSLYRGVQVVAGTNRIDWSRNSFGVSGNPPSLTLSNAQNPPFSLYPPPCVLRITVTLTGSNPPAPGDTGSLQTPNSPGAFANPGPWNVVFDNDPAGHWSLRKAAFATPGVSNNAASAIIAATFRQMVANGSATVIDGAMIGCQP